MADTAQTIINAFSAYLRDDRRRSPHTVRAYVITAERFCAFLMDHIGGGVDAAEIAALKQADIRSYLAFRRGDGLTNNSAARELSALRAFLKFVGGDEAQIPKIKGPKLPDTGVGPVDETVDKVEEVVEDTVEDVLTLAQAIVQCTLDGLIDNPLSATDRFDQCIEDYTTPDSGGGKGGKK